jgi:hypothetical protein
MKSKTYYNLILDQSGSMSSSRIETLNAVNAQIESGIDSITDTF